jgi:hypothetical protein
MDESKGRNDDSNSDDYSCTNMMIITLVASRVFWMVDPLVGVRVVLWVLRVCLSAAWLVD